MSNEKEEDILTTSFTTSTVADSHTSQQSIKEEVDRYRETESTTKVNKNESNTMPQQETDVSQNENKDLQEEIVIKNYFLSRVNSTFSEDLVECIANFKLTRECVTNNKTWHTVQEIVISRLDG